MSALLQYNFTISERDTLFDISRRTISALEPGAALSAIAQALLPLPGIRRVEVEPSADLAPLAPGSLAWGEKAREPRYFSSAPIGSRWGTLRLYFSSPEKMSNPVALARFSAEQIALALDLFALRDKGRRMRQRITRVQELLEARKRRLREAAR
jgi:hypothetical protein